MSNNFEATETWYEDADAYWESIEASDSGMLGGLDIVHVADVRDSTRFVKHALSSRAKDQDKGQLTETQSSLYALDCGAGIGRVTKHMLAQHFDKVDIVEQNAKFVREAESGNLKELIKSKKVVDLFICGLQSFNPEPARYDVIWCQWVLSHLTDNDLVSFFKRCVYGLKQNGLICVKENTCGSDYLVDKQDSSVTRSVAVFENLFALAGLKIIEKKLQFGFPQNLFKVRMWALVPE